MGLIKESKRYHDTADKILKSTGLLDLLSRYGEVKPIGAYSYDLMLSGDLIFMFIPIIIVSRRQLRY